MTRPVDRTWDGLPVSPGPPYGATVVVYRRQGGRVVYLILHRAHLGPAYEGDWAWGPPAGARLPGEPVETCARRELREETGLELPLAAVSDPDEAWQVYMAEAPRDVQIRLSPEHDRYAWLPAAAAAARCRPALVAAQITRIAALVEKGWDAGCTPGARA